MTRGGKRFDPQQDALPLLSMPWTPRRVERALNEAVRRARAEGELSHLDDGAVTLARALARAVDVAESKRDLWALATVARELRAVLERLRLDPAARGVGGKDGLAEFLAALQGSDE
jgi:hypothetical protein